MIQELIQKYIEKLNKLRANEEEFKNYEFTLSKDKKQDENQKNRFRIGVGLFNDLQIPEDYSIVKRLFEEELKHRNAKTENYDFEVIYMYCYFLSEFGKIEDVWQFAELKFDGSMDADLGFDTGFFLTFGKEELRHYLNKSTHRLKEKIQQKIFSNESWFTDENGMEYKENQISYFGLKEPILNPIDFYMFLDEKELFKAELNKWKSKHDLCDILNANAYINYAEYLGDEDEIYKAMNNYKKNSTDD